MGAFAVNAACNTSSLLSLYMVRVHERSVVRTVPKASNISVQRKEPDMRRLAEIAKAALQYVIGRFTAITMEEGVRDDNMYSYHLVSSDRKHEEFMTTPMFMPLGEMVQLGTHKFYVVQRRMNGALDTCFTKDYERVFFFLIDDSMWTQFEGNKEKLDIGMEIVEKATYNIVEKFLASNAKDQMLHLEEYHAVFMAAGERTAWLS